MNRLPVAPLRVIGWFLVFLTLTVTTQVGGVILIGSWFLLSRYLRGEGGPLFAGRLFATLGSYLLCTLLIIPPLARLGGRSALPWFATAEQPVAPRSIAYCLLNRHYVDSDLADFIRASAVAMKQKHPGTTLHYLDANFPFLDGFPLLPHLSHDDGRKIDLAFLYHDKENPDRFVSSPSPIGYWIYEPPMESEPAPYRERSCLLRWDFAWLQGFRRSRQLDRERTRDLLGILLSHADTEKVLLELHLHHRFGFPSHPRLKFQQCNAARHDDHIHLQVN